MLYAIKELEKVVKAMSRKVVHLEEEIVKLKIDSKENKDNEHKEPFKDASDFHNSTPVSLKQKPLFVENKSIKSKKDKFKCAKCEYQCKTESTLKKHTNKKHVNQECMKNNKNIAKLQESDEVEIYKKDEKDELSLTQRVKDSKKSFIFSEFMLDKFL